MKLSKALFIFAICTAMIACSKDSSTDEGDPGGGNAGIDKSLNQQNTGTSANDLLSDVKFKSTVVELVYVDGFKPTQSAIDGFVAFLQARSVKPAGITVESRSIPSPGIGPYDNTEIRAIEDDNRTKYNDGDQIAVWAFFADSESASNTSNGVVLGTAYRNTSFVIYEETIHGLSDSTFEPNRDVLESTVIHHEFGHILGLTNLGSTLQSAHEDGGHPKHCDVESCLMYWAAETGSGIDNLLGQTKPAELDSQCIADLQANGGR